jgi:flagellar basal body-associated protein FliL
MMPARTPPAKIQPKTVWISVILALTVFTLGCAGYMYWHARDMAQRAQVQKEQQYALAQLRARAKQRQLQKAQEAERSKKLQEEDDRARATNAARQKAIYERDKARADFYEQQESQKAADRQESSAPPSSGSVLDAPSPPPPADAYSEGTGPDQAVQLPSGGDTGQSPTY